jgi:hypothetical protein
MNNIHTDFGDVLLWSFWVFIWVAAFLVWFRCVYDMFSDYTLSGWAKAGWAVVLIFIPWVGALIYLIARGHSIAERQHAARSGRQAAEARHLEQSVSTSSPADQIANAKALLDAGTITQAEFETLKAKAMA